ncbi:MAG: exo-alpha-sialidase [Bacteroidales bacterium]|jgi:hypothetical protein|nr:exo-alpha-sialidase [Bacteroidales bacterium]MDD2571403.1 exo-alpha-sialidase [Bacteroidales bacterium]MDD3811691.1 exo-alpha-sialidase [Bacteroidales bacterium]
MKIQLCAGTIGLLLLIMAESLVAQSEPTKTYQELRTEDQSATLPYHPDLPAGIGNANERLAAFRIEASSNTQILNALTFNLTGTTDLTDLTKVRVYFTGSKERFMVEEAVLFGSVKPAAGILTVHGQQNLRQGENYVWITTDVSENAKEGNRIAAHPLSYTISGDNPVQIPIIDAGRTLLLTSTLLFSGGDAGSKNYRIPAIVTATDGSLVTATDKRWNNAADLPNHIDVVIRRSTDQGRSWSDPVTIAGEATTTGFGDPALMVNRMNGDMICLFASGKGWTQSTPTDPQRIFQSISSDNGITWSDPVDITDQIYGAACTNPVSKNWSGAFVTSGAATQLSCGRLMAVLAARETTENVISNFVIYSDDGAKTWQASTNRASYKGDEAKVVELDHGDVLMSIRHSGNRWFNVSKDKGVTWLESPYIQADIIDPFCNGDIIRYTSRSSGYDRNRLLHSIPYATSRKNVSVLLSYDEGGTWPVRKTICPGASAYSSLCVLDDVKGTIGIYVEVGEYETYQMYFMSFSLDWLTDGKDHWSPPVGTGKQ